MENNPQVAVMMPVYNGEKTLGLALSSLVHQSYPYWKCYIVNDGSTDGTKEILEGLTDPRFVIIHFEQNKGRPYARQAALDAAEGKYLAFLDADDFYHPDKLEEQVRLLESNPDLKLVSCRMGSFDKYYNLMTVRANYDSEIKTFRIGELYRPARAAAMVYLSPSKKCGYNLELKYAQDTDFFMRYLDGKKYLSTNRVDYFYSEYDSVSKKKIIVTNYYGIILYKQFLKNRPFFAIKRISINILKISFKILVYPFVDAEFYLSKRGGLPTDENLRSFKSVLKINIKKTELI